MKRTIVFPSMPGRDSSKFDPSQQMNLGLLHEPHRQGRSLVYDNIDPDALKRHTPCPTQYSRTQVERFLDPPDIRAELREERLALRDASRLERLTERQQRRHEYEMDSVPKPSATSKKSVQEGAKFSVPKASRGLGASSPPPAGDGLPAASHSVSLFPHLRGAVDFSRATTRSGKSPMQLRTASSLELRRGAEENHDARSQSVPPDAHAAAGTGAVLGDFISPTSADVEGNGNANRAVGRSPDGATTARGETEHVPAPFFLSKRELYALRDLPAPDLKRAPGRSNPITGTNERKPYAYESSHAEKFNLLDISTAHKLMKPVGGGALPFGKAGRDPQQPQPISKDDPLVKAARRVQDEITESICPQYRAHLGKMRLQRQRERRELADQAEGPPAEPAQCASPSKEVKRKKPKSKEPLYHLSHGGGRITMNLDVLFRGKRFKDLLAMHDFMIDRELNSTKQQVYSAIESWGEDEGISRVPQADAGPLSVAERMEQGLPVTFEEALGEAERREHLLQLRCLSLNKDGNATGSDALRTRGSLAFGSGPDRFSTAEKAELEDKAFGGLNQLKVETHSPATAMFRSHMKLKQLYDALHEKEGDGSDEPRSPETSKHHSMRRMSMLR